MSHPIMRNQQQPINQADLIAPNNEVNNQGIQANPVQQQPKRRKSVIDVTKDVAYDIAYKIDNVADNLSKMMRSDFENKCQIFLLILMIIVSFILMSIFQIYPHFMRNQPKEVVFRNNYN